MMSRTTAFFEPDLIVEVTSVCDRACPGCYSPTLRTKAAPEQVLAEHPEMFLMPEQLRELLAALDEKPRSISLRGGEPSRHPLLGALSVVARETAELVYVETHARWLLNESELASSWLEDFAAHDIVVKVSFDRMHGLKPEQLQAALRRLDEAAVAWQIAITEPTEAEFERSRVLCGAVDHGRILFQHKVTDHRLLVQPRLGTIDVSGARQLQPTAKMTILP